MDEPGTDVSVSPYPLAKARGIMRSEYGLGLSAQNEILTAVAQKLEYKKVSDNEFEIALRQQVSVWQQS